MKPKVIILRTAGTNCDYETQAAFELAGAIATRVHINEIINGSVNLNDFQILALPGGFSYGDDIASGKILANEIKYKLMDEIKKFNEYGKPIIGICNGFQVLVKMGLLPDDNFKQSCSLIFNDSDRFECRWVYLKVNNFNTINKCLWTKNLPPIISLPVAHGEGKFVTIDNTVLKRIEKEGKVVFRYTDLYGQKQGYPFNPNGSLNNIAGITNSRGNILGLMPHPERFIFSWQHPGWTNRSFNSDIYGFGLKIFRNAVESVL